MPLFQYKAKKDTAQTVFGEVNAKSEEEAIEMISQMGLMPVSVEAKNKEDRTKDIKNVQIKSKDLYVFTRQLATLLKSGIQIIRALEIIRDQTRNSTLKVVVQSMADGIRDGNTFSQCLSEFPRIFNPLFVNLIKAGEESGSLKSVITSLSEYQRKEKELINRIKSALMYPLFMAVVGFLTVIIILVFVMPRIIGIFTDMNAKLPLPTVLLLNLSHFLKTQGLIVLLLGLIIAFLCFRFKNSTQGRKFISRMQLSFPLFGPLALKIEIARFFRTLELLFKSGISVLRAIQISIPVFNNELLKEDFMRVHRDVVQGGTLGTSLRSSPYMKGVVSDLIKVGEESGFLVDVFKDIADNFEEDTQETIKRMTTLLEPMMILVIGGIIGFMVFAMLLPIFQIDVFAS